MANDNQEKALGQNGLLYFWQFIKGKLGGKVDKVDGKGLSANDYTTAEKNKLNGIAEEANKTTVNNTLTSSSTTEALSAAQGKALDEKIKNLGDSLGGLGYGDMMKSTYDADNDGVVDDSAKLGGQAPSYYAKADGTNIKAAFTAASSRINIATGEALPLILGKIAKYFADLKTVAFTGSYNDLKNQPTIPSVTNDLTNTLKSNYDAAYTHSKSSHAPVGAQANVIEVIKVNGVTQTVSSKAVNLTVPKTVADMPDAKDYAKKSDLTNVYQYAGSVPTFADLPTGLGPVTGTTPVYNVESDGMNWGWNGTAWDNLGSIFEIAYLSNAEIDQILAT